MTLSCCTGENSSHCRQYKLIGVLRLRLAIRFALRQTPLRMTGIESEARRQGPSVRAWEHPPVIVAAVAQSRGDVVGLPEGKLRTAGADAEFSEVV